MTGDCSTSLPCAGTRQCLVQHVKERGYARHQRGGSGSMTISPARAMPGRYLSIGIKEVYIWQLYAHFVVMNFVLCWTLQFHTVLVVNKIYVVSNIAVVWTNMITEYAWNSLKNLKLEPSYLVSLWLGCVSYIYCIVLCYTNESLVSGTAPPKIHSYFPSRLHTA